MKIFNPHELDRGQLIDALRPWVDPAEYQAITREPTAYLRAALAYAQSPKKDQEPPAGGTAPGRRIRGV